MVNSVLGRGQRFEELEMTLWSHDMRDLNERENKQEKGKLRRKSEKEVWQDKQLLGSPCISKHSRGSLWALDQMSWTLSWFWFCLVSDLCLGHFWAPSVATLNAELPLTPAQSNHPSRWVLEFQKVLRHHLVQPSDFIKEKDGGPERLRMPSRQSSQVRDRAGTTTCTVKVPPRVAVPHPTIHTHAHDLHTCLPLLSPPSPSPVLFFSKFRYVG